MADLARLNILVTDMEAILTEGGIGEHSLTTIATMKEKKQFGDILELLETFMESMAFIDHDAMTSMLTEAYKKYLNVVSGERKIAQSKYDALKEDKKAEADRVAVAKANLDNVNDRRGAVVGAVLRLKAMDQLSIKEFMNPEFDAKAAFADKADKDWHAWNK